MDYHSPPGVGKDAAPYSVLTSLQNQMADHCVDIFVRSDGTFGFEEYRRDHEDLRGWFSLHRYARQVFDTEERALAQARSSVAWMVVPG
jgi:hypothetical protein